MKKIKLFILSLVTLLGFSFTATPLFLRAGALSVDPATNINCGASGDFSESCDTAPDATDTTVTDTVQDAIRLFQVAVGLIAVVMIIFGGLKYITSGGNDNSVKAAKNTLLYAVIGLIIVLIAESLVRFVLTRFS